MLAIIDDYRKELLNIAAFEEKTVQNYVSCLLSYSVYTDELFHINFIKSEAHHILKWIAKLKADGLSLSRLQHHQSALKTFFTFLNKIGILKYNPTSCLPHIRRKKSDSNKPITKDVAYKLLRSIDQTTWQGRRNFLIISLLWALGLRVSELTSLKVRSLELKHDPKQKIGLLRIRGKNKKQRAMFIVDKLYKHMIAYLADPQSPQKKSSPLFPTKNRAISNHRVLMIIKQYAKNANIKERITPHILRHSFATEMYHQKVPLSAIQAMMGHSGIDETETYIHVSDQLQKTALELISINRRIVCQ